mgnify:FL=1|jgi:hypothetical protein|tara:strand:+ start:107 stop:343 length:237 start_codon:yes stop_codon:yes gene_type:complete
MKNLKLETISFDTIAKAVKNCTDIKSNNFLTWSDFAVDDDATFWSKETMYYMHSDEERGHFTKDEVDEAIEESQEAIK